MPKTANKTEQAAAVNAGRFVKPSVPNTRSDGIAIGPAISLAASYRYCKQLARRTGRNFYFSFLTLPRKQFRAMCALYAFMRVCDDLGDEPHLPADQRARALRIWRQQLDAALGENRPSAHQPRRAARRQPTDSPIAGGVPIPDQSATQIFPALADTVARYSIPAECLHDVIDGVEADLQSQRFETFEELNRYCYQVAGAVGLCCIHIWGFTDDRAIPAAIDCGTAFQLTNILRDLGEDAAMGRCYLPREDLRRFDLTESDIAAHCRDERFRELMRFEVNRARGYYAKAGGLFDFIERPGRPILSAMLNIYGGLLDEIERRDYDVFTRRVSLSRARKMRIALGAIVKHRILRR